jgi:hypothetical protein
MRGKADDGAATSQAGFSAVSGAYLPRHDAALPAGDR